jgi:MinD superfamily P-loop ATPase
LAPLEVQRMVVEVEIDYDRCTSCKKCLEACTFGVLEWFEDRPIVVNPSNCSACLECKMSCPADAIRVEGK